MAIFVTLDPEAILKMRNAVVIYLLLAYINGRREELCHLKPKERKYELVMVVSELY